ncbi:MAG: PASTA domain-containing protein [Clostridia bacterium]|nr:PASTA domain-containing protein [Clostridia bacterium]
MKPSRKVKKRDRKKPVSINKRILATGAVVLLSAVWLIVKLIGVQFVQAEELQQKALSQWMRDTALTASRGEIVDSNGITLAQSGTAYKVLLWPQNISEGERERISSELSRIFNLDYDSVYEKTGDKTKREIVLKRQVSREQVDEVASLKLGNGVATAVDTKRYYSYGTLLSQVLGYTTIDSVGQSGLELSLDKYLSGQDGRMITETDNAGQSLVNGVQEYIEPIDGCDVKLTVDSSVQTVLERALREAIVVNNANNAQGIIMDCTTGAIVAISTQYSEGELDLNNIAEMRSNVELLTKLSRNRVVADSYEPGSTFKIITLSAALDSNAVNKDSYSCTCGGASLVSGQRIRCWRTTGHGTQNLTQSTENSCNCAYMDIALRLGTEKLYDYIYAFGFGQTTESGMLGESGGIVTHEKYILDYDLARIGFGQSIAVTPIQLATAVSAAVNGGILYKPYIVDEIIADDGTVLVDNEATMVRRVISDEASANVREILTSVVDNGSGRNAQIAGYKVGGKTGTAQKYDENGVAEGKLIASFVGFAPADDPKYVVLILVDEPQVGSIFGSTVAAPFVREVMEETLRHFDYLPSWMEETVTVPNVVGMTTAEAEAKLLEFGLEAVFQDEDVVTRQVPAAGDVVNTGTQVLLYTASTVYISDGDGETVTVVVPDLSGLTRLQAYDMLRAMGLILEVQGIYAGGVAISQSIEAGTEVPYGTTVGVSFGTPLPTDGAEPNPTPTSTPEATPALPPETSPTPDD